MNTSTPKMVAVLLLALACVSGQPYDRDAQAPYWTVQQQPQPGGLGAGFQEQQQPGYHRQQGPQGGLAGLGGQPHHQPGGYRPNPSPRQPGQQPYGGRPGYPDDATALPSSAAMPPYQNRPAAPGYPNLPVDGHGTAIVGQDAAGNVLELEPHGAVRQPQPGTPDMQMFHTTGGPDQALYAIDWSHPRARNAPANLVLKRWGGLSPPEYVAVYRLRGSPHHADASAVPSYSLANDELRHYPWDATHTAHTANAARRQQQAGAPRWRAPSPRDEEFELLPPGASLMGHGHNGHGGHGAPVAPQQGGGTQQQHYMYSRL